MAHFTQLPKSENIAVPTEELNLINLDPDENEKIRKAVPQITRNKTEIESIKEIRPADHIKFYKTWKSPRDAIVENISKEINEVIVIEFISKQQNGCSMVSAERKIYKFSEMKFVNVYVYDDQLDVTTTLKYARSFLGDTDCNNSFGEANNVGTYCKTGQIAIQDSPTSSGFYSFAAAGLAKLAERFSTSLLSELVEKVRSYANDAGAGGLAKIKLAIEELYELIKDSENFERSVFQEKLKILISKHTFSTIAYIFAAMVNTPASIPSYISSVIFIFISSSLDEYGESFGKFVVSVRQQWSDVLRFFNEKFKHAKAKVIEMYNECKDALYDYIMWYFSDKED